MADDSFSVLVVEDEPISRRLIQTIIERRGNRVEAVGDAESAWTAFERSRHPLIVLDWMLPGMNGVEFCRRVRATPDTEDVYILFVTGHEDSDHLSEALEAGASDFLGKAAVGDQIDVRLAIAERHVRRALARRRFEEELAKDALHDPVTTLPNRQLFLERLHQAARRAKREQRHLFAVLIVDVDKFKEVNKSHGRDVGDRVLMEV